MHLPRDLGSGGRVWSRTQRVLRSQETSIHFCTMYLVQHASLILQIWDWLETPMLKYKSGLRAQSGLRLSFKIHVGLEAIN